MVADVKVRKDKVRPVRNKYPFEKLVDRGDSFFLAGADAHRVRQASISFEKHHPEIAEAGDKIRVNKEKDNTDDRLDPENMVDGVGVYRVEKED